MKTSLLAMYLGFTLVSAEYRVVGYMPTYRAGLIDGVDITRLTHLMAAFANPDVNGDFAMNPQLQLMIDTCKNHPNVKPFVSIGGGGVSADLWTPLMGAANRSTSAQKIADFAFQNGFVGVDVDLEGALVQTADYAPFVSELRKALDAKKMQMTAAVAKWTSTSVHDSTFAQFDFINLMAYDYTGPWSKKGNHAHSTIAQAQGELDYYSITRKIPVDKIVLGVPFYGYDFFDLTNISAFTWSEVVMEHPEALDVDSVKTATTAKYYNGRKTIRTKAEMAIPFGGIMIWELGQDDFPLSEFSLFTQIAEVKDSLDKANSGTSTALRVRNADLIKPFQSWSLLNLTGQIISQGFASAEGEIHLPKVKAATYILKTQKFNQKIHIK